MQIPKDDYSDYGFYSDYPVESEIQITIAYSIGSYISEVDLDGPDGPGDSGDLDTFIFRIEKGSNCSQTIQAPSIPIINEIKLNTDKDSVYQYHLNIK